MEDYSAIRKNETWPFATRWMDLEDIMPSESKSAKGCLISLICVIEKIIHKAHARQPGSSNHLPQLEKARHSNRVPGNPKNILEIIFFLRTKKLVLRAYESVASHGRRDSAQLSSALSQSRLTLCDPMDCSMPGLLVHHQVPEFTETHVH